MFVLNRIINSTDVSYILLLPAETVMAYTSYIHTSNTRNEANLLAEHNIIPETKIIKRNCIRKTTTGRPTRKINRN